MGATAEIATGPSAVLVPLERPPDGRLGTPQAVAASRFRWVLTERRFADTPDEQLVARVRAGEDSAFEAIYDRYAHGVLAFCANMLGSRDDAEDALQLTFVSAYRALRVGDQAISLRPWLYTIARNRCLSELRLRPGASAAEEPVEARAHIDGPADQVERREELDELLYEIRRLPSDQRLALVLFELGDHSHAEIATLLGVRREKVKALIFQAREALARGRAARDSPCAEIREELATVRTKILPRSMTRSHIDRCPSCTAFEHEVCRQRVALALIAPVGLVGELKASVLGAALGHAVAAAGIGASGTSAALASGTAGAGSAAAGAGSAAGAATVGGVAGAGAVGGVAGAGTVGGVAGAGAVGGVAGAGAVGGVAVASAAPAAIATGLTAGGTELAVVGGLTGAAASSTAVVAKVVTAVVIATGVIGAGHAIAPEAVPIPAITSSPAPAPAKAAASSSASPDNGTSAAPAATIAAGAAPASPSGNPAVAPADTSGSTTASPTDATDNTTVSPTSTSASTAPAPTGTADSTTAAPATTSGSAAAAPTGTTGSTGVAATSSSTAAPAAPTGSTTAAPAATTGGATAAPATTTGSTTAATNSSIAGGSTTGATATPETATTATSAPAAPTTTTATSSP